MKTTEPLEWTHSDAIGLSYVRCTKCEGSGLTPGVDRKGTTPCKCVLRAVFQICLAWFHHSARPGQAFMSAIRYEHRHGADSMASWSCVAQDYMADFYLIAKRTLTEKEFAVFRFHHLWNAEWRNCCRRLGMDKGSFFHAVYRVEEKLGQVYHDVRPYALYPPGDYFGPVVRKAKVLPFDPPEEHEAVLRAPAGRAA